MNQHGPAAILAPETLPGQNRIELFGVSLLVLFLELTCIRWLPAHVLFLAFFTNTVLLASFLGMSLGCLTASSPRSFIRWTPIFLIAAMVAAHLIEHERARYEQIVNVGRQSSQLVFFGTEYRALGSIKFVPVELICGFFFVLVALGMLGPGQELGRALDRIPNRVIAYTINILGSLVGIVLFAACSLWQVPPLWWFSLVALGLAWFAFRRQSTLWPPLLRWFFAAGLLLVIALSALTSGTYKYGNGQVGRHFWSPYYRIDYSPDTREIAVNLIAHQRMLTREGTSQARDPIAYELPYLLRRDTAASSFQDVLIIGAGSGNDLSRALQWNAGHVDAVEIDPVIQRLGSQFHPDSPYGDSRVTVHLNDGRNFLRSTDRKYDLIVFALVDSLTLHSSYSNIRLESYLFTNQAFADVRRCLKPGGVFAMYNFFREGWIVSRLAQSLNDTFNQAPLILVLPYEEHLNADAPAAGFVMFLSGDISALRAAFRRDGFYWIRQGRSLGPQAPDGFQQPALSDQHNWLRLGPSTIDSPPDLRPATDEWPFLYLRRPMIPMVSLRGIAIMGVVALALVWFFVRGSLGAISPTHRFDWRMFFLGAGFMLIETKAVVEMALLFGSTWIVNTVVFFAALLMILIATLFVLRCHPTRIWPYYAGLLTVLALNIVVPMQSFLGLDRVAQIIGSCMLVFSPILFAGVIFAIVFAKSQSPDRDFGANIAGAMLGGLSENASMLIGFKYLVLVAAAFYIASAAVRQKLTVPRNEATESAPAGAD